MRNSYALLFIVLISCAEQVRGQAYGELNIGDVRARFYANGRVAFDTLTNNAHFQVPQSGAAGANYAGGLWVGGQSIGGQLRVSTTMYDNDNTMQFFPGPLTEMDATTTQAVSDQYNQVWSITKAEIVTHLTYYQCLSDPNCNVAIEFPNGYTIPNSILDWPAMGLFDQGYSLYLAPFHDFNEDGAYDPQQGDAPCILGDQSLFNVFNDHLGLLGGTFRSVSRSARCPSRMQVATLLLIRRFSCVTT